MATAWRSSISGPITSHPMYEKKSFDEIYDEQRPRPRVRPEARVIAEGHRGAVGHLFELQGQVTQDLDRTKGRWVSKDYLRENIRRMREIQRASQQRNEQKTKPVKPMHNSRYEDTNSKVASQDKHEDHPSSSSSSSSSSSKTSHPVQKEPPLARRPASAPAFLRAHEKTGPPLELSDRPLTPVCKKSRQVKLSVPRATSAREVNLIRRDVNFVRANAHYVKSARIRRSPSNERLEDIRRRQEDEERRYRRGEIPNYLIRRREEWMMEEEERRANTPDPDMPPGHRQLPERERREIMDMLKHSERLFLDELCRIPIRMDTLRLRKRKEEIERKLTEIEEALKVFNKPKVFICVD